LRAACWRWRLARCWCWAPTWSWPSGWPGRRSDPGRARQQSLPLRHPCPHRPRGQARGDGLKGGSH